MSNRSRKRKGFKPLDENELARLTFHGAAGNVTGSCFLFETEGVNVLFECGMFQGGRDAATRNRRPFPFDPGGIDIVVLTHAHIDHSGLLPKLVRDGFRGKVHATGPTCDLLKIMLPDSGHIHEQDAKHASRRQLRRGKSPVEPLYTVADAELALAHLHPHEFGELVELTPQLSVRFMRAGHILGAASVEVQVREGTIERKVVFSGDVGRANEPILLDPEPPGDADLVLLESTYGDRDHKDMAQSLDELATILDAAGAAGENVIIPVFAVGRTQEILYHIGQFEHSGRIRQRRVFLDSPMAIHATELHLRHPGCFRDSIRDALNSDRGRLEPAQLSFCRTPDESMALNSQRGIVILAASGMCDAGRVVHHLKHNLWRSGSHVVIVGFQARGTVGRALVDGARKVRILGEEIAVQAQIHTIGGFSAHAGQTELTTWVRKSLASGAHLALLHGESEKRSALAAHLSDRARHPIFEPELGDSISICKRGDPIV